tara:strand:+ start:988 stop:1179 length:192 start_codon:yes stop_codon:yes gene_type:complete
MDASNQKPIEKVIIELHSINLILNEMKMNFMYIKSELDLIKHSIKNLEEKVEPKIEISKGYWG